MQYGYQNHKPWWQLFWEDFEAYTFFIIVFALIIALGARLVYAGWHEVCPVTRAIEGKSCYKKSSLPRGGLK